MIYSVDFRELCGTVNPFGVAKYVSETGWDEIATRHPDRMRAFNYNHDGKFEQIIVPIDRTFKDYKDVLFSSVKKIADVEEKPLEQVILYLLNPSSDILKVRLAKKNVEPGNILLDDAVSLFDNAKKLLSAAAMDVVSPSKYHRGRPDDNISKFLGNCRFGQTEVGSYIISVVCPFAEIKENEGYRQLSIFSDEEMCASSLTRKVTNQIIKNAVRIKKCVDAGNESQLIHSDGDDQISANFMDALSGFGIKDNDTTVEIKVDWSPVVKNPDYDGIVVSLNHDYYSPISEVSKELHSVKEESRPIIGRIEALKSLPDVEKRREGTIRVVYIDSSNHKKTVSATLDKENYDRAIEAHAHGNVVRMAGTIKKNEMDCTEFDVIG